MKNIASFIFLLLLILPHGSNAQNDSVLYSFIVAGHTYGKPGVEGGGLYPPFKEKFSYLHAREEVKFGVFTGDIVPPNPTAWNWDQVDADVDSLGVPVYFTVGNHDMENRELYESRYGKTFYSFNFEDDLFIVLDPNIDGWNISGEQLLFLQHTLEENIAEADNIFVFFHQLLWWKRNSVYSDFRPNSFEGKADTINFWSEVEPLFSSLSNPVFFFAGDVGAGDWAADFMYDNYQNISLIASGMGEGIGDNFVVTNVHADKTVNYDLICLNDSVLECFGDLESYKLTTHIKDISEEKEAAKIYPNPVKNGINIQVKPNHDGKIVFKLFDLFGTELLATQIERSSLISVPPCYGNGIYFYRIELPTGLLQSGKIIIQR